MCRLTAHFVLLVLALACLAPTRASAQNLDRRSLQRIKKATVYVRARHGRGGKTGSGFLVYRDASAGLVATNAHVVTVLEGRRKKLTVARRIEVVFESGSQKERELAARVVGLDPIRDLAILRIASKGLPLPIEFKRRIKPFETQNVFLAGFPFGAKLAVGKNPAITISRAAISSLRKDQNGRVVTIQVDGSINPGNSGGPCVTNRGDLVGVAVAKIKATQIGFVIPADHVREAFDGRLAAVGVAVLNTTGSTARVASVAVKFDPFARISAVGLMTGQARQARRKVRPRADGHWPKISRAMKLHKMVSKGSVYGIQFDLDIDSRKSRRYFVQPVVTNAKGTFYLEPGILTMPSTGAASGYVPRVMSINNPKVPVRWFLANADSAAAAPKAKPKSKSPLPSRGSNIELSPRVFRRLKGHEGTVTHADYNDLGSQVVSAGGNELRRWLARRGRKMPTVQEYTSPIRAADFRGLFIVGGSEDGSLFVKFARQKARKQSGHAQPVNAVAIFPGKKAFVSASQDKTLVVWNLPDGSNRQTLRGHQSSVEAVVVGYRGRFVYSGDASGQFKVWELARGRAVQTLRPHRNAITAIGLNRRVIVTGSLDGRVSVMDLSSRSEKFAMVAHTGGVTGVDVSRDGRFIASVGRDDRLKIWSADDGALLATLANNETRGLRFVRFSPDSVSMVFGGDGKVILHADLMPVTARTLFGHRASVRNLDISQDARHIVSASHDKTVRIWDTRRRRRPLVRTFLDHQDMVRTAVFSPDLSRVVSGGADGRIRIWDRQSGKSILDFPAHTRLVKQVVFSPDGSKIASAGWDNTAKLWDAKTGKLIHTLAGHTRHVSSVSFASEDRLASVSWDRSIRIWDLKTGKSIKRIRAHRGSIFHVTHSPDKRYFATSSFDRSCVIWNAKTNRPARILRGHTGWVGFSAFSPDSQTLATSSGDETIRLWEVSSGKTERVLKGHWGAVRGMKFTADGKKLVSASQDRTIKVWTLPE